MERRQLCWQRGEQLYQRRGREEAAGLVLRSHRHRDRNRKVGLAHAAGAKQQQVFRLQQPGGLLRQALQLLPLTRVEVLVVKPVEPFLPREMGAAQQALLTGDLPLLQLQFTERVEELARAPALGLSLFGQRLPVAAKAREFQLFEQQRQGRFHRLRARNR